MTGRPGTAWRPEDLAEVKLGPDTTVPAVDPEGLPETLPGLYVWDHWPVTDLAGNPVEVDGRRWWAALTAPDDVDPEDRHHVARIRLATSEGPFGPWEDAGRLFPEGSSLGSREWAGSTVWEAATERMHAFYTAAGRAGETEVSYEQRLVRATGSVRAVDARPVVDRWGAHDLLLRATDRLYKDTAGTVGGPGRIDAMRDPAYAHDPADGRRYVLFTATLADSASEFDGCVGVADAVDDDLGRWRPRPPLLHAEGVNKELERPQLLVHEDRYLLFLTTHHWTFAPGIEAPEGLYGFVAERFAGPYEPLNGSGLVLGNPGDEPHQTYSWTVLPGLWVHAFADYPGLAGRDLAHESERDPDFRRRLFGGRAAPSLRLELDGTATRTVDERLPGA